MLIDPENRYQTLLTKLQGRGFRLTADRMAIIRLITSSKNHPNATQLYESLRVSFPTLSLATVYKTLARLKEEGEVLQIDLHSDSHYDGEKPYPHPHLVCNRCGKIFDGDQAFSLDALTDQVESKFGFKVTGYQFLFYGMCQNCQNKEQDPPIRKGKEDDR